jgi:hypothetical protein
MNPDKVQVSFYKKELLTVLCVQSWHGFILNAVIHFVL